MARSLAPAVTIACLLLTRVDPVVGQPANKLDLYWRKLGADIARVDASFDGVMGVAVKDLTDGRTYVLHADERMPTASMIKIATRASTV